MNQWKNYFQELLVERRKDGKNDQDMTNTMNGVEPITEELCSFSNLSVTSPTSQPILQPFRRFTYVTAHSPTLLSLYLRHSSLSNLSFASPMSHRIFTYHHLASRPWWLASPVRSTCAETNNIPQVPNCQLQCLLETTCRVSGRGKSTDHAHTVRVTVH